MKIINKTRNTIHLPYARVALEPGENEIADKYIKANEGHKGFEQQIDSGKIEVEGLERKKDEEEENTEIVIGESEYPKKSSVNSPWYELSDGRKVRGKDKALYEQEMIEMEENNG
ncbi:MAG: hypothetical protein ACLFPS_07850 [Clostridia bacterium]